MAVLDRLPAKLSERIAGYEAIQNRIGHSNAMVFQLIHPANGDGMYLKIQALADGNLEPEKARLEWLQGKLPVPRLLAFVADDEYQYLLMSEVKGVPSFEPRLRQDMPGLVRELARGLRMIHALDRSVCPFAVPLAERVRLAEQRLRAGTVDVQSLSARFPDSAPQELFDEMMRLYPAGEDLVVCHGDYSLPNILMQSGRLSGFIDVGQLAVSDRYVDLVTVRKTFRYNGLPEECFMLFANEYGIEIDEEKLRFYDLLDALTG